MFRVIETAISGCIQIVPRAVRDIRGTFVKTFHEDLFFEAGLENHFAEEYYSVSHRGVLRGLHFQLPPHNHTKVVYCLSGSVMDVVVDLRVDSPTFGQYLTFQLSSENPVILYIPSGLAHGFYVESETAILQYKVTTVYAPEHDAGIRWDSLGIPWPTSSPTISARDSEFPEFRGFVSPFRLEKKYG